MRVCVGPVDEKMFCAVSFEKSRKLYWVEGLRPVTVVERAAELIWVPSVSLAGGVAPVLYTRRYSGPPPAHARSIVVGVVFDGVSVEGAAGRVVTVKLGACFQPWKEIVETAYKVCVDPAAAPAGMVYVNW